MARHPVNRIGVRQTQPNAIGEARSPNTPTNQYSDATAIDRALAEVSFAGQPELFESTFIERKFTDQLIPEVKNLVKSSSVAAVSNAFNMEINAASTPEEMANIIGSYNQFISRAELTPRSLVFLYYLNQTPPNEYSYDTYTDFTKSYTQEGLNKFQRSITESGVRRLREVVQTTLEQLDENSLVDSAQDIASLVLMPFQDLMLPETIRNHLEQTYKDWGADFGFRPTPSGINEQLRDWISGLSETQQLEVATNVGNMLVELEQNLVWGTYFSSFNARWFMEGLFSVPNLNDEAAEEARTYDTLSDIGNAADILVLGGVVMGLGRGIIRTGTRGSATVRRTSQPPRIIMNADRAIEQSPVIPLVNRFNNSTPGNVGATADAARTPLASNFKQLLQQDSRLSIMLGEDLLDAAIRHLPIPRTVDDMRVYVPGGSHLDDAEVERIYRQMEELEQTYHPVPGSILSPENQHNAALREINAIENISGGRIQESASTIRIIGEDAGINIRAIIGSNENQGYFLLSEAIDTALALDKTGTRARVLYVADDGTLKVLDEPLSKYVNPDGSAKIKEMEDVLRKQTGRQDITDEFDFEFFIEFDTQHYFHSADKLLFGEGVPVFRTGGLRNWLTNSLWLGNRSSITDPAQNLYRLEALHNTRASELLQPYNNLSDASRMRLQEVNEWSESVSRRRGRGVTVDEILTEFEDLSSEELLGLFSYRAAQKVEYRGLNARLHRDWSNQGYITAYKDGERTFHVRPIELEEGSKIPQVYDPIKRDLVELSKEELAALYGRGGFLARQDLPEQVANFKRGKWDTMIVDPSTGYQAKKLDYQVLPNTPGYYPRFLRDEYIVVRKYDSVSINGANKKYRAEDPTFETAVFSSTTSRDANAFVKRANRRLTERRVNGRPVRYTYAVKRLTDVSDMERTAALMHNLRREGRMFLDNRQATRIRSLQGGRAPLINPSNALERQIQINARMNTSEEYIMGLRQGFYDQFAKKFEQRAFGLEEAPFQEFTQTVERAIRSGESTVVQKAIKSMISNSTNAADKAVWTEAKELWDWIRMMDGAPAYSLEQVMQLRTKLLHLAQRIELSKLPFADVVASLPRYLGLKSNPLKAISSAVHTSLIVLNPIKQLLLQAGQVSFIAPLSPKYVMSGRIFRDANLMELMFVNRGLGNKLYENINKAVIKSEYALKDFEALNEAFYNSGILSMVDVHSWVGDARAFYRGTESFKPNAINKVSDYVSNKWTGIKDWFNKVGFARGERKNLTFTYLMSARSYARNANKRFSEFNLDDWEEVANNAINGAFAMNRLGSFKYQRTPLSLALKFQSYAAKASLTLLGQNPGLRAMDPNYLWKVWLGGFTTWGANFIGAQDWTNKFFNESSALKDVPQPVKDIISRGVFDMSVNSVLAGATEALSDLTGIDTRWQRMNFGKTFATGPNLFNTYRDYVQNAIERPLYEEIVGPGYTLGSRISNTIGAIDQLYNGQPFLPPEEKTARIIANLLSPVSAGMNNAYRAFVSWENGVWVSASNRRTPIETEFNSVILNGLLGIRADEVDRFYDIVYNENEVKELLDANVENMRDRMRRHIVEFNNGEFPKDEFYRRFQDIALELESFDDYPHLKNDFINQVMNLEYDDGGTISEFVARIMFDDNIPKRVLAEISQYALEYPEQITPEIQRQLEDFWNSQQDYEAYVQEFFNITPESIRGDEEFTPYFESYLRTE